MRKANSESPMAAASASMCPASDSSARLWESQPPTPSATVAITATAIAIMSLRCSPARSGRLAPEWSEA